MNAAPARCKRGPVGPLYLHRADALRGCEPGEPGGCPADLWQRLGRTQTPFNVVLVHVYTQHTHAVERAQTSASLRVVVPAEVRGGTVAAARLAAMVEVIGDSARGEDFALVRLTVEGDRIVAADASGLERELAG